MMIKNKKNFKILTEIAVVCALEFEGCEFDLIQYRCFSSELEIFETQHFLSFHFR